MSDHDGVEQVITMVWRAHKSLILDGLLCWFLGLDSNQQPSD
jgi:hypothetical protein